MSSGPPSISSALPHAELGPNPINPQLARTWHSGHLVYRAVEPNDADVELLWRAASNPQVSMSTDPGLPKPPTHEAAKNFVNMINDKNLIAAIACLDPEAEQPGLREDDLHPRDGEGKPRFKGLVPIGMISVRPSYDGRGPQHRGGEVGLDLLAPYQGMGYGTEIMCWALDWAFDVANLHRVRLVCFSWNTRAIRCYEKIGFTLCGNEREALWAAGKWWNELIYDILEGEWRATRERVWREVARREKQW